MVGVCIKYMHENYGGILQAYATVSYLENKNVEYELIRYTKKKNILEFDYQKKNIRWLRVKRNMIQTAGRKAGQSISVSLSETGF